MKVRRLQLQKPPGHALCRCRMQGSWRATCPMSRRNPFEWSSGLFDYRIQPAPGGWDALTDISPVLGLHFQLGVTGIETPSRAKVIEASVILFRAHRRAKLGRSVIAMGPDPRYLHVTSGTSHAVTPSR